MTPYVLKALPGVENDLEAMPDPARMRVRSAVRKLVADPRPAGSLSLTSIPLARPAPKPYTGGG